MKSYKIEDLKKKVRIALDNNASSDALITTDIDTLTLEEIIEEKILDAVKAVVQVAPSHMLGKGTAFATTTVTWDTNIAGVGRVQVPDDFFRLIAFKMSDWSYAVSQAITQDDPLYAQQHSKHAGVRGCPQRPVVAIVHDGETYVEFFSCACSCTDKTVTRAEYVPIPKIESVTPASGQAYNIVKISHHLIEAVVYYIAHLVAVSVGDANLANAMLSISKEFINAEQ